jgi:hypothetical protein
MEGDRELAQGVNMYQSSSIFVNSVLQVKGYMCDIPLCS